MLKSEALLNSFCIQNTTFMLLQIEEKIKQIQDKLLLLSKQHAAAKKENLSLKKELAEAKLAQEKFVVQIDALQQQMEILKYTHNPMEPDEKKEFEKRITSYIKEIDKCVTLLNS
jgi:hypothetical protein